MQLTPATVQDVFKQSLQGAQQTIVTVASMAEVRWSSDSEITLAYPPESSMAMKRMEQAEYKGAIGEALQQIVGRPVQLNLVTGASRQSAPVAAKPAAPKLSAKEKMDRMREVEAYPWIQACVETFQAEVVKVDMPR